MPVQLNPKQLVAKYLTQGMRTKTAGEVRFIKDRSGDETGWAFQPPGASVREPPASDFSYNPKDLQPLAACLEATLGGLGLSLTALNEFAKLSTRKVSGDGLLGGRGYVQKVSDMRRQFTNIVEALSALSDTLYDEIEAPHWAEASRNLPSADSVDVQENLDNAKKIKKDPEAWAENQLDE